MAALGVPGALSYSRTAPDHRRTMKLLPKLLIALALTFPFGLTSVVAGQGQQSQQEALYENADGRLRGYEAQGIVLEESSVAPTYLALLALAVIALGVMFKSARRSHLD